MSFAFYGIKDSESIIAIPGAEATPDLPHWSSMTQDTAFNAKVSLLLDSGIQRSTARLRDLAMIKFEKRPRQFRRWCSTALNQIGAVAHLSACQAPTVFGGAENPSSDPLPILWTDNGDLLDESVVVATDDATLIEKTPLVSSSECPASF
jgi:hypothetical protein